MAGYAIAVTHLKKLNVATCKKVSDTYEREVYGDASQQLDGSKYKHMSTNTSNWQLTGAWLWNRKIQEVQKPNREGYVLN